MCGPIPTGAGRKPPVDPSELPEVIHHPQVDTGIHCSRCRYNLTGLTVPRCPECGEPFHSVPERPSGVTFEHVLFIINVFSLVLLVFLVISTPPAGLRRSDADAAVVVAMLAPLQWVLALAAMIAGLHSMNKGGRSWIALAGLTLPGLLALVSLCALI